MTSIDDHEKFLSDWEEKNSENLSPEQMIELFTHAIHAVELRACVTLSSVTLLVILDRVLTVGQEKYKVLSTVSIEKNLLNFKALLQSSDHTTESKLDSLRFYLCELLRVLGRITANILTVPLHQEILSVTSKEPEKK